MPALFQMTVEEAIELLKWLDTPWGKLLEEYMAKLEEEYLERNMGEKGFKIIFGVPYNQGFVSGIRSVSMMFSHARMVVQTAQEKEQKEQVDGTEIQE